MGECEELPAADPDAENQSDTYQSDPDLNEREDWAYHVLDSRSRVDVNAIRD
jgi:hypothetical protein